MKFFKKSEKKKTTDNSGLLFREKIGARLALRIGIAIIIVMAALTVSIVLTTGSRLTRNVVKTMDVIASQNATLATGELDSAESMVSMIADYTITHYREITSYADGGDYNSAIYPRMKMTRPQMELESTYIDLLSALIRSNDFISGGGIFFAPDVFNKGQQEYAVFVDKSLLDKGTKKAFCYTGYFGEQWYTEAEKSGKLSVSDPYDENGFYMVTLSKPIKVHGKVIGVCTADINVDKFAKMNSKDKDFKTMMAALVDHKGRMLFHSRLKDKARGQSFETMVKKKSDYDKLMKLLDKKKFFHFDLTNDTGHKYRECFMPVVIEDTTWWAVTGVEVGDLYSDVYSMTAVMLITSIVSIIVLLFMLISQVKTMLRPLAQLQLAANALQTGDFSYQIEYKGRTEIGVVCSMISDAFDKLNMIIQDITEWMSAIEDQDFSVRPKRDLVGDFISIQNSYNSLLNTMNKSFTSIKSAADQINLGANQVSSGATSLSQGATEQAASVEELSASIAEVSQRINQNADATMEANRQAVHADQELVESNKSMSELMNAMKEITDVSNEISKIIKTIDDIAFQTNILALNAAVDIAVVM